MEYNPKFTNATTTFTRDKPTWDQARRSKKSPTANYISSIPNTGNSYKPTWDLVQKPKQPTNANRGYLSLETPSQSSPNGPTQAIVNTTSIAAQLSSTCVHISWGNCGKPGSFAYRRFLEEMAEEVATQEGFEHAKIL